MKKKIILMLLMLLLLTVAVKADFYSFETTFKPQHRLITYIIPPLGINSTSVFLDLRCLNITSGRINGTWCFRPVVIEQKRICWDDLDCQSDLFCAPTKLCETPIEGVLDLEDCEYTFPEILIFIVLFGICAFFIMIGFLKNLGFVGFFGTLLFFVISWYISACQPLTGYILTAFSLILMIYFVILLPLGITFEPFKR